MIMEYKGNSRQRIHNLVLLDTFDKKLCLYCWKNDKTSQSMRTFCSTGIFFKSEIRNKKYCISFKMYTFLSIELRSISFPLKCIRADMRYENFLFYIILEFKLN